MAYRRNQGIERSATFVEDHRSPSSDSSPAMASPRARRFADDSRRPERSLASQALLASAARGDVPALAERFPGSPRASSSPRAAGRTNDTAQDPFTLIYNSMSGSPLKKDETKQGLWGILAQQAKVMLDENEDSKTSPLGSPASIQAPTQSRLSYDRVRKSESPTFQNGAEAVKLDIGVKIKNAFEEGLTTMAAENRTAVGGGGRKLQIRRKTCGMDLRNGNTSLQVASPDRTPMVPDLEYPQIKASRDVASAMSAKVKLLQRELKTVKADLAFSKERCTQLEEENRLLRDGKSDADEDLIRRQLETLLAEKARLANENTVYARENLFMREIVEFHQLNTQGVVNLQEDIEEEDEEGGTDEAHQPFDDLRPLSSRLSTVQEAAAEHVPATPAQSPLCRGDKVTATLQSPLSSADREPAAPDAAPQPPCRTDKVLVPAAAPPSPCRTDKVVVPAAAPQSPCRTDKVLVKTESEGAIHAASPMRQSFKDGNGSLEKTPVRSFNDDNSSPETASDH